MAKDTMEVLLRKATDDRTPIEEARNCALAYVRKGGKVETEKTPDEIALDQERERIFLAMQAANRKLQNELSQAQTALAQKHEWLCNAQEKAKHLEDENKKLRKAMKAIVDYVKAGKKLAEAIFATNFLEEPTPNEDPTTVTTKTPPPTFNSPFNNEDLFDAIFRPQWYGGKRPR
jgi:predicted  nucleic acid-binding Zn-ribbon protein